MTQNKISNKKCSLPYCDRPHYAKGMCAQHYRAMRRNNGVPTGQNGRAMYDEIQKLTGILKEINSVEEWWLMDTGYCMFCKQWNGQKFPSHLPDCTVLRVQEYTGG